MQSLIYLPLLLKLVAAFIDCTHHATSDGLSVKAQANSGDASLLALSTSQHKKHEKHKKHDGSKHSSTHKDVTHHAAESGQDRQTLILDKSEILDTIDLSRDSRGCFVFRKCYCPAIITIC